MKADKETGLQPEKLEKVEQTKFEDRGQDTDIEGIKSLESGEKGREVTDENTIKVSLAATESKGELFEQSLIKEAEVGIEETSKLEERNMEKMKEMDKSKISKPQEVFLMDPVAREVEKSLLFSADMRVSRAREAYGTSQKGEAQVMTESDESPSAIEMEEIPKAKVSMVPWSRKGHFEPSSSSEDSAPHVELRQEEGHGKPSPEGTESILSEEPEMESLYPSFDCLTGSGDTKNEVPSQEPAGSSFSVRSHYLLAKILLVSGESTLL